MWLESIDWDKSEFIFWILRFDHMLEIFLRMRPWMRELGPMFLNILCAFFFFKLMQISTNNYFDKKHVTQSLVPEMHSIIPVKLIVTMFIACSFYYCLQFIMYNLQVFIYFAFHMTIKTMTLCLFCFINTSYYKTFTYLSK